LPKRWISHAMDICITAFCSKAIALLAAWCLFVSHDQSQPAYIWVTCGPVLCSTHYRAPKVTFYEYKSSHSSAILKVSHCQRQ
jgi:hypothetical protein